jgi:substrate-binding family protein
MATESRRGWVGWIEGHRPAVAGVAMWVVLGLIVGSAWASGTFKGAFSESPKRAGSVLGPTGAPRPPRESKAAPRAKKSRPKAGLNGAGPKGGGGGVRIPGAPPPVPGTGPLPTCTKRPSRETGVSDTQVRIGQIITDYPNLPQQFGPAYEGLSAYVKLVNERGGVCGRKLAIEVDNDQANPSAHDYESMAQRVFAFVGNESLLDGFDYQTSPPFYPKYRDARTGGFVPDVGGLALAYGRAQSPMHAGVIGSVSPVLRAGGEERYFVKHAAYPCRKASVVFVVEPTGASQDQAELGKAALAESWGAGLGYSRVREYQASLGSPVLVYRGIVENMVRDGVNCVFSYTDLASNINLVNAMYEEGVWPPKKCNRLDKSQCFGVVWVPFAAYDPQFIADAEGGGEAAMGVVSYLPHLPVDETSTPALRAYLRALAACNAARYAGCGSGRAEPSTFSLVGFASGIMFVEALSHCGGAPKRSCVMGFLKRLKGFDAGGLIGGTTPFACTFAAYGSYGRFCWKWIFASTVAVKVTCGSPHLSCFRRINPRSGFFRDRLHVARGRAG